MGNGSGASNGGGGNGAAALAPEQPRAKRDLERGEDPETFPKAVGPEAAAAAVGIANRQSPTTTLRFILHESADHEADREHLDALIALIEQHPGPDAVRLFVHGHDGDKIELTLPNAAVTEGLRATGIVALGPSGNAEILEADPVPAPAANGRRTRGVEPLEV